MGTLFEGVLKSAASQIESEPAIFLLQARTGQDGKAGVAVGHGDEHVVGFAELSYSHSKLCDVTETPDSITFDCPKIAASFSGKVCPDCRAPVLRRPR